MAILIGLVILAAVAVYVGRPLRLSRRAASAAGDTLSLEAQRESLYTQIKELDLDHATGKVNDEDYTRLRAELVVQAAAVLKHIDGMTPSPAVVTSPAAAPTKAAPDDVEALIAARRKTRSAMPATTAAAPKSSDADMEAAIAARRKTVATLACPQCGKPINADDVFCAKCGTALRTQPTP